MLFDWPATLSLVFGGCCSNAITLEQLTSRYPHAGSLITLFQFLLISLHGLPKHVTWTPYGPRFKPRRIPLTPYLVQVALFYLISLLNNIAFGYDIPMSVHIIFRSGGLIISMIVGYLFSNKHYNFTQVLSVLLVTLGVALTTLSATPTSHSKAAQVDKDTWNYFIGITILTLALVLSGFLGLAQDWTYSTYGRPQPTTSSSSTQSPQWQESMFYLHFLALPMFFFLRHDLSNQFHIINNGPSSIYTQSLTIPYHFSSFSFSFPSFSIFASPQTSDTNTLLTFNLNIPYAYTPLFLNTMTQLLCVAGVHRLTTRVSSLTVTLVLVVRKAVSLVLSVLGAGIIPGLKAAKKRNVDMKMMWSGAVLVLVGTVLYSIGTGKSKRKVEEKNKDKKE